MASRTLVTRAAMMDVAALACKSIPCCCFTLWVKEDDGVHYVCEFLLVTERIQCSSLCKMVSACLGELIVVGRTPSVAGVVGIGMISMWVQTESIGTKTGRSEVKKRNIKKVKHKRRRRRRRNKKE